MHFSLSPPISEAGRKSQAMEMLTVSLEPCRLTIAAASLIDCLDEEDISRAALQPMHCIMVLLDVGDDHPAVHRIVETWKIKE